jgi:hypothetical protein
MMRTHLAWVLWLACSLCTVSTPAQANIRCLIATQSPVNGAITVLDPSTASQTFNIRVQFSCQSTTSTTKTGLLTVRLQFTDGSNTGSGTYLKNGSNAVAYTFNNNPSLNVNNVSTTFPTCTTAAPSNTSPDTFNVLTDISISAPGGSSARYYYWNTCVRIPVQTVSVPGTYMGKVRVSTQGTVSSGGGNFLAVGPVDVATMTLTKSGSCSVASITGISLTYPAFSPTPVEASTVASVTCSSGLLWNASFETAPGVFGSTLSNQNLLGLNYAVSATPTGNMTGTGTAQTVNLKATVGAGQAGICSGASCQASNGHTLTISY